MRAGDGGDDRPGPPGVGGRSGRWLGSSVPHPLLIGAYPVIALYARNVYEARPSELYWPLGLVGAAVALVWTAGRLATGDGRRAGLLATTALVLFWSADAFPDAAAFFLEELNAAVWVRRGFEIPRGLGEGLMALLAAGAAYWCARRASPGAVRGLTVYLNVFAAVLVGFPAVSAARARLNLPSHPVTPAPPVAVAPRPGPGGRPDIYYIILDGFARADVLRDYFAVDVEPMLRRLEAKGFYIARRSTSNYAQTPLSIASSLNAQYLDPMVPPGTLDFGGLFHLIGHGSVVETLRGAGYTFVSFATGFDQTERVEPDSYRSPYWNVSGFHRMLMTDTPLRRYLPTPGGFDSYTMTRDRTLYLFDQLPVIARDPAPTFTLAHVLAPHPPFVFGAAGEDVSPRHVPYYLNDGSIFRRYYGGEAAYKAGYGPEAAFLARRVERCIDEVLAASPEPPLIILQSDHGSGSRLDTDSAKRTDLHERMSILNCYLFPNRDYRGLDDRITPVNSFRAAFNACLGARLPRLPDRSYFSRWNAPFTYIDVTAQVRSPDDGPGPGVAPAPLPSSGRPGPARPGL